MAKRNHGYVPSVPQSGDYIYFAEVDALADTAPAIPDFVDLSPDFPGIWNQWSLASCVSHAVAAVYSYCAKKQGLKKGVLARLFMWHFAKKAHGISAFANDGVRFDDSFNVLLKMGAPGHWWWPYQTLIYFITPFPWVINKAKENRAVHFERCSLDEKTVINLLSQKIPIVVGINVPDEMKYDNLGDTGIMPMPIDNDGTHEGHAVVIVGYDQVTRLYKIRNSWGRGYGDDGHVYVPYAFINDKSRGRWAFEGWVLRSVS